jgi:uncharacterized membrane protein YdjX (TVP38/TMEM64 family)
MDATQIATVQRTLSKSRKYLAIVAAILVVLCVLQVPTWPLVAVTAICGVCYFGLLYTGWRKKNDAYINSAGMVVFFPAITVIIPNDGEHIWNSLITMFQIILGSFSISLILTIIFRDRIAAFLGSSNQEPTK